MEMSVFIVISLVIVMRTVCRLDFGTSCSIAFSYVPIAVCLCYIVFVFSFVHSFKTDLIF